MPRSGVRQKPSWFKRTADGLRNASCLNSQRVARPRGRENSAPGPIGSLRFGTNRAPGRRLPGLPPAPRASARQVGAASGAARSTTRARRSDREAGATGTLPNANWPGRNTAIVGRSPRPPPLAKTTFAWLFRSYSNINVAFRKKYRSRMAKQ
jgi:hypothetical protein